MTASGPLIVEIQRALKIAGLDGWLFYDFKGANPIAFRVLRLDGKTARTRRWFYLIPAEGVPARLVHAIEPHSLDELPGKRLLYSTHQELAARLAELLKGKTKVAMEYSPKAGVPTISRVDAGTVELVRAAGVRVESSGDLVQAFESVLSPAQVRSHWKVASNLRGLVFEAFAMIAKAVSKKKPLSEHEVQQFLLTRLSALGLVCDHPPIVAFGHHTADPHYAPIPSASTRVRSGDLLLIDLWAKADRPDGVYADITWMGFAGASVPAKYAAVFHTVRSARDAAVRLVQETARTGKRLHGWQVDEAARAVVRNAGLAEHFIHRTGHSIGSEVHGNGANMDNYETQETRHLLPGTLFSIEPGVYQTLFGLRSEIDVYFGEGEAYVTTAPAQSAIVPILKQGALHA